jgi:hypothetical protein
MKLQLIVKSSTDEPMYTDIITGRVFWDQYRLAQHIGMAPIIDILDDFFAGKFQTRTVNATERGWGWSDMKLWWTTRAIIAG